MGLRINTNLGALSALRSLHQVGSATTQNFERMSSGLKINRASDDPSGLVLLSQLRGQLGAIDQAVSNTQMASNMFQTAEGGLHEIGDQLVNLRALAVEAANDGVNSPESLQALQSSMDSSLRAINRISQTTRFSDTQLLNGTMDFTLTNISPELQLVQVQGGEFAGGFPQQVNVNVVSAATHGESNGTIAAVQSGASTIRVAGKLGSQDINIQAGATQADVEEAINSVKEFTGVEAANGTVRSTEYGSDAYVNFSEVSGDFQGVAPGLNRGTDVVAEVFGQTTTGKGNVIDVGGQQLSATVRVKPETTGNFSFTVAGGGVSFQLGTSSQDRLTTGVGASDIYRLGLTSGISNLASLQTGGPNSLASNPQNAMAIIDSATNEVSTQRSRLGGMESRIFESNIRNLNVAFENLSSASSSLGDANMADEIAHSVRNRLVREAGMMTLRQSNLNAGLALRLLM